MSGQSWREVVDTACGTSEGEPGRLLLVLQQVQGALGYVPPESIPVIADRLNLSRAEVHGVISFYHDFRDRPGGRVTIKVCRAESCQAVGAATVIDHLKASLGIGWGETTPDGRFTLEPVYCLGNCALSPALVIGDEIHGRVTPGLADALLAKAGAQ
jgi:formate dehydrogenase subunit gamma